MGFFNIEKNNNNNKQNTFFNQTPNMMEPNNQYNNMYNQPMGNPGMQQGMMQPGMVPNNQPMMNQQQYPQQGMMNQQPMMNQQYQPMGQQPMMGSQQGMMNQPYQQVPQEPTMEMSYGQRLDASDPYSAITNVSDSVGESWNNNPEYSNEQGMNPQPYGGQPTVLAPQPPVETPAPVMAPQPVLEPEPTVLAPQPPIEMPVQSSEPAGPSLAVPEAKPISDDIETLDDELGLPREEEDKEEKIENPKADSLDSLKIEDGKPEGVKTEEPKVDGNSLLSNPIFAPMEQYKNIEDIGEQKNVKANVFAAIGIILGMLVKPGTTMLNNAKKFKKMNKALSILAWIAVIFLVLCIGVRVVVGSFARTYSSLTDSYKLVFDPARIFDLSNYVEYIIIAAVLSVVGVLLVALIYYASSFLNSKGVHFATYLIVSNLGMIPLISGSLILYPIASIFSGYLGLAVLILSFLTTVIVLLIGMNEVLKFKSLNNQIFYHVLNLSVITLIAIMIFVFMIHNNWVILPQISI